MKRVCLMGITPASLATALVFADANAYVTLYDADQLKVDYIASGDSLFYRKELTSKMQTMLHQKLFKPSTILTHAEYFIIYSADNLITDIYKAAERLVEMLKIGDTIIIEAELSVGTTEKLAHYLEMKTGLKAGRDFYCAYVTQRFVPGKIFYELINSSRIIGGINTLSAIKTKELYQNFVLTDVYTTQAKIAEMATQVITTHREVELAFANEVSSLCYTMNLNPHEIIDLANKSFKGTISQPDCGEYVKEYQDDIPFNVKATGMSKLLSIAQQINSDKPFEILRLIKDMFDAWKACHATECKIVFFGLTRTANCDDLSDAPSLHVLEQLSQWKDCQIMCVEPNLEATEVASITQCTVIPLAGSVEMADIAICLVPHTEFLKIIPQLLTHPYVIDVGGILQMKKVEIQQEEYLFWPAKNDQTFKKMDRKNSNKFSQDVEELE